MAIFIVLSCIIFERKRDIGRKSRFFHTPPAFDDPFRGSRWNSAIRFGMEKNYRLPGGEKSFENVFTRFDTIHERDTCDRHQTDGQTDKHRTTARAELAAWVSCSHAAKREHLFHYYAIHTYV